MKNSIAQRIKQARLQAGLTQAELARRMGISRTSASIWESGGNVSQENLPRLAKVLKVTPEWLHYGVQRDEVDHGVLRQCIALACEVKSNLAGGHLDEDKLSHIVVELYTDGIRGVELCKSRIHELIEKHLSEH